MTIATAGNWPTFAQSSSNKKSTLVTKSQSTGQFGGWMVLDENARIKLPRITDAAGSIMPSMSKIDVPVEELDELDAEIDRMSESEVIAVVLASAGSWADRDDLDDIMDRRDRIDELYAPYIPDDPDSSI